jgi:hypothetical protein
MLNAGEANDKTMENRSRIIEEHIVQAMMNGEFSASAPFRLDDAEIKALNSLGYDVEIGRPFQGFHWISWEDKDV